jgi:hypothetical protein
MRRLVLTALTVALLAIPAVASTAVAAPSCAGMPATIVGNPWSELIVGTFRDDVIVSRGGNDMVLALSGDDVVCSGAGRDVVLGGRGDDQIFGDNGNDRLLGNAGFDALDGGAGRDRCRVGAGGGTTSACESGGSGGSFDLAVEVSGPSSADDAETFQLTVSVRNAGNAPTGAFTLIVADDRNNVVCSSDPTGSFEQDSLDAGQSVERVVRYDDGCEIQAGNDPHVRIRAEIQQGGSDSDPSNDSDSTRVEIVPRSGG